MMSGWSSKWGHIEETLSSSGRRGSASKLFNRLRSGSLPGWIGSENGRKETTRATSTTPTPIAPDIQSSSTVSPQPPIKRQSSSTMGTIRAEDFKSGGVKRGVSGGNEDTTEEEDFLRPRESTPLTKIKGQFTIVPCQTDEIELAKASKRRGNEGLGLIVSALYGKLLVVMGIAFPMAEVISSYIPPSFYDGFYLYLYFGSITFMICVYGNLLRQKATRSVRCTLQKIHTMRARISSGSGPDVTPTPPEDTSDSEECASGSIADNHYSDSHGEFAGQRIHGSFYLRMGAVAFGIGSMIYSLFETTNEVLEYLLESKPQFLKDGDTMLGVDIPLLQKEIRGLADKLSIHGYPDRRERLLYLHSALSAKLANKEDMLKTVIKFLLEMSERPSSLLELELETATYSFVPDEEISDICTDIYKQKQLLKQILQDEGLDEEPITLTFSSDSELSDWTSDEDGEKSSEHSTGILPPVLGNMKPSQSFSDFSGIQLPLDDDEKRRELEMYWNMESIRAKNFMNSDLRTCMTVVKELNHQPVISGLLTLHAKFGEHWEWKNRSANSKENGDGRFVISEEDAIREILWQFSALNPENSTLFTPDWNLKPGLMVPSLSLSSFSSIINRFQKAFISLSTFKSFAKEHLRIITDATTEDERERNSVSAMPKILSCYSKGLSDLLNYFSEYVGNLEKSAKEKFSNSKLKDFPTTTTGASNTLIQIVRQLDDLFDCIETINGIHSLCIVTAKNTQNPSTAGDMKSSTDALDCSLRLIFTLAMELNIQTQPKKFGVVLFLFSKCLHAFLDEINSGMSTLNWPNNHPLFQRSLDIKLSDKNFWTDSIKLIGLEDNLSQIGVTNIPCVTSFLNDILTCLKTSEMLNQLNEDYVKIIGQPPRPEKVVTDFLELLLTEKPEASTTSISHCDHDKIEITRVDHYPPDYKTHFKFIGLEGSLIEASVKSILENQSLQTARQTKKSQDKSGHGIHQLISINEVPTINSTQALELVFKKWYGPLIEKAKNCIFNVFEEYNVDQSMKIFKEIILGAREDFAQAVIELASPSKNFSKRYNYEDEMNRNPMFQKLLNECYSEGRENFEIELRLDRSSDTNYSLNVKPHFPLNLILQEDSVEAYLFVSKQLHRIRKNLWDVTYLNIKDCKIIEDVEPNRVLLFRFALIHFCSSLRAFLVFKIFGRDKDVNIPASAYSYDLDATRKAHSDDLSSIETQLLRNPIIDSVIIRKMTSMSETLKKLWTVGIPSRTMILLEDTLKKCWTVIQGFQRSSYSADFNELSYHFGPPPSYL